MDIELERDVSKVCIDGTVYDIARDYVEEFIATNDSVVFEDAVYTLASMIQSAFDQGKTRGWENCQKMVVDNLFKRP